MSGLVELTYINMICDKEGYYWWSIQIEFCSCSKLRIVQENCSQCRNTKLTVETQEKGAEFFQS